jgi:hypothetical protein
VERAISYFRVSAVALKSCAGLGIQHFQLERIKWREQIHIGQELCKGYNGDMRKWFFDWIRSSEPRPGLSCWRTRNGEVFCDGDCVIQEVILSIPLVLIVEIGDILEGHHWNIPKSLAAYANNPTARAHGVNYTIAAHLYTNPSESHFIARYSSDMTHVYDYDGREHDGNAVFNAANMKSLTGLSDSIAGIPDGYHLTAVVYHLDGGEGAQRYFCQEQVRLANKMGLHFEGASGRIPSSCELRRKHLEVVSDEDRSPWLPNGSSAVDYVISPPEKSPNKGQAPGARVHRRNSIISLSSSDEEHGWHPPMALLEVSPRLVQLRGQAFLQSPPFRHLHTKPALQGTLKYFGVSPVD